MHDLGRIAVIGASPIGCILAASLAKTGKDVTLIGADADLAAAIEKDGLSIEGIAQVETRLRALRPSAAAAAATGARFDTIFICVKTDALAEIVRALPLVLEPDGTAIRFRNGLETEGPVLELVGPRRCLRAVVNFAGGNIGPGRIAMTFFDPPNYVGAAAPGEGAAEARAHVVVDAMNEAGLHCEHSADIRARVWQTAIRHSAILPISALTGMDVAQAMGSPSALRLIKALLDEGIAVAAKVGLRFDDRFRYDSLAYFLKAGHHMPSMWGDVRKGRRTEIEVLNHRIAELGALHGILVPHQRTVADLVRCMDDLAALGEGAAR